MKASRDRENSPQNREGIRFTQANLLEELLLRKKVEELLLNFLDVLQNARNVHIYGPLPCTIDFFRSPAIQRPSEFCKKAGVDPVVELSDEETVAKLQWTKAIVKCRVHPAGIRRLIQEGLEGRRQIRTLIFRLPADYAIDLADVVRGIPMKFVANNFTTLTRPDGEELEICILAAFHDVSLASE